MNHGSSFLVSLSRVSCPVRSFALKTESSRQGRKETETQRDGHPLEEGRKGHRRERDRQVASIDGRSLLRRDRRYWKFKDGADRESEKSQAR